MSSPQVGHTKIFLGFAAVLKYPPGWPAAHQHRLLLKLVGSPNFWGGWHQAGEFEQAEFHFLVAHFNFRLLTLLLSLLENILWRSGQPMSPRNSM